MPVLRRCRLAHPVGEKAPLKNGGGVLKSAKQRARAGGLASRTRSRASVRSPSVADRLRGASSSDTPKQ